MHRLEVGFVATVFRLLARALAERLFESGRTVILLQDIGERFVGKFLNVLHRVPRKQVKRVPRLGIECDQLAFIGRVNGGLPCRPCRLVPASRPFLLSSLVLGKGTTDIIELLKLFSHCVSRCACLPCAARLDHRVVQPFDFSSLKAQTL
jgi:hypothetical protein